MRTSWKRLIAIVACTACVLGAGWFLLFESPFADTIRTAVPGFTMPWAPSEESPAASEEFFSFSIPALRAMRPSGCCVREIEDLEDTIAYRRTKISYQSGGDFVTAAMNVPERIAGRLPVIVFFPDAVDPLGSVFSSELLREQDFFARAGYLTIALEYRSAENGLFDFGATAAKDAVNLLDALFAAGLPNVDTRRIGVFGFGFGGLVAQRLAASSTGVAGYVFFAPAVADPLALIEYYASEQSGLLRAQYGKLLENPQALQTLNPLAYVSEMQAPLQVHHGSADEVVPLAWSDSFVAAIRFAGKEEVEYFRYEGERHRFGDASWGIAANRARAFFDRIVRTPD